MQTLKIACLIALSLLLFACSSTRTETAGTFDDEELGISFEYPTTWGEITASNKRITFVNRPEIVFEIAHFGSNQSLKEACQDNRTKVGNTNMKNENGEDVYAKDGFYKYGDCEATLPYLYSINSNPKAHGDWVPLDEVIEGSSEILLNKSYYTNLNNPYYPRLTISIDLPSISSQGTCSKRIKSKCDNAIIKSTESDDDAETVAEVREVPESCPLFKNLTCINYEERGLVESVFSEFENSAFGVEIENLLAGIVIKPVENAEELFMESFNEKYADLSEYSDKSLGLSFTYPTAFGEVKFDEETNKLKIGAMGIRISTLADAIASDAAYDGGPACDRLTAANWESSYASFSNQNAGESSSEVEVLEFNGNKMLVGRYGGCGERIYYKRYTTFVGDKRFEIYSNILINPDSYEGKMLAGELLSYKLRAPLIEAVLDSMRFL